MGNFLKIFLYIFKIWWKRPKPSRSLKIIAQACTKIARVFKKKYCSLEKNPPAFDLKWWVLTSKDKSQETPKKMSMCMLLFNFTVSQSFENWSWDSKTDKIVKVVTFVSAVCSWDKLLLEILTFCFVTKVYLRKSSLPFTLFHHFNLFFCEQNGL